MPHHDHVPARATRLNIGNLSQGKKTSSSQLNSLTKVYTLDDTQTNNQVNSHLLHPGSFESIPLSTTALPRSSPSAHAVLLRPHSRAFGFSLISVLTIFAFLIHGYHPYAEDGGLYVAGIKHVLSPSLYAHGIVFVDAHLRYSIFAPAIAVLVRVTHLSLPLILFALYFSTIWATLYAVWLLATRCYLSPFAHAGAATLMAVWLTLPVAGTSLILVDPYLTARSLSLTGTLFTLVFTMDANRSISLAERQHALLLGSASMIGAILVHPLMGAYGLGDVLLLACLLASNRQVRNWGTIALCALAVILATTLQAVAPIEPAGYLQIAASRYYWFLSHWHWYEVFGLLSPLCILAFFAFAPYRTTVGRRALARMAVLSGTVAILVALLFACELAPTHLVSRLQPLRAFQVIYVVMIISLGATVGEYVLKQSSWRWIAMLLVLGGIMLTIQRSTYPASAHIEWPGDQPSNPWQQAFLWISHNTPRDALFALDADYISLPEEDAQNFRALAERSALPDYSKDGGEAAIAPALTAAWISGQHAQRGISTIPDAERLARLRPLNVTWLLLQHDATTAFVCPFQNRVVKVCHLP